MAKRKVVSKKTVNNFSKPTAGTKKRKGRPAGSINEETRDWLEKEGIKEEVYRKILNKIKNPKK